jgi:predicted ATPase
MNVLGVSRDFRFGEFDLRPGERQLLDAGAITNVGPRALDVLICLVERAGHLVTKEELFRQVWPKVVVDDSALQVQISALRKILGPHAIATVSGRGYRFMSDVSTTGSASPAHNLSTSATTFIGREQETARLVKSLARARLLTLTGAGGCGKTRLALQVAASVVDRFPDGVWLVELASLAEVALVPQAVLSALGAIQKPTANAMETLTAHLASRHLLLVLDNAEHMLAGCAALCDTLLRECQGITLLVTSRQKLDVPGESAYRVPSMSVPDALVAPSVESLKDVDSVRLFIDRARQIRVHFALTEGNASAVASICSRLDGIPLAIELAAGRLRSMPVEELSQRLDQRFSLLSGGSSASQPRHRTLRALIDWSYDLLSDAEQAMLRRLSVFAGGCSLQGAEQVCSDDAERRVQVLDLLAALGEKNLLVVDEHPSGSRYRLFETVWSYARDRLRECAEQEAWERRHTAHMLAIATEAFQPLQGGLEQASWIRRIEADDDNLRAALTRSFGSVGSAEDGMRLVICLNPFWVIRGRLGEARGWAALAVAAAERGTGELLVRARVSTSSAILASYQGDSAGAMAGFEQALRHYRELDDGIGVATALNNLGIGATTNGDYAKARAHCQESADVFRAAGETRRLAAALCSLGNAARHQQDVVPARASLAESMSLARSIGDLKMVGAAFAILAGLETELGNFEASRSALAQALVIACDAGNRLETSFLLDELAYVTSRLALTLNAARLWGAASELRTTMGASLSPAERDRCERRVEETRQALDDEAGFQRAWQAGASTDWKTVVCEALEDVPSRSSA